MHMWPHAAVHNRSHAPMQVFDDEDVASAEVAEERQRVARSMSAGGQPHAHAAHAPAHLHAAVWGCGTWMQPHMHMRPMHTRPRACRPQRGAAGPGGHHPWARRVAPLQLPRPGGGHGCGGSLDGRAHLLGQGGPGPRRGLEREACGKAGAHGPLTAPLEPINPKNARKTQAATHAVWPPAWSGGTIWTHIRVSFFGSVRSGSFF
jgi:hypothetical protein